MTEREGILGMHHRVSGPSVNRPRTHHRLVECALLKAALPPNSDYADERTPAEIHHPAP
jgi:hypothetical protein